MDKFLLKTCPLQQRKVFCFQLPLEQLTRTLNLSAQPKLYWWQTDALSFPQPHKEWPYNQSAVFTYLAYLNPKEPSGELLCGHLCFWVLKLQPPPTYPWARWCGHGKGTDSPSRHRRWVERHVTVTFAGIKRDGFDSSFIYLFFWSTSLYETHLKEDFFSFISSPLREQFLFLGISLKDNLKPKRAIVHILVVEQ